MQAPEHDATGSCWLGTVAFGSWGNPDHDECIRTINRAIDAGILTLDTAASYADGESETIVGKAVRGRRDEVHIATKYGYDNATAGASSLSSDDLRRSLDASLIRLDTDHVDLFFLHRVPKDSDYEALAEGLDALVRSGKTRAVGTSMATADGLRILGAVAEARGLAAVTWEQPPYSIFVRRIERDILGTCRELGVSVAAFAPLNGGWLTGKYRHGKTPPPDSRAATWPIRRDRFDDSRAPVAEKLRRVEALDSLARRNGLDLQRLALGFALANPDVTAVIVGPRTKAQLEDLLTPGPAALPSEMLAAIDEIVAPDTTVDPSDVLGYDQ